MPVNPLIAKPVLVVETELPLFVNFIKLPCSVAAGEKPPEDLPPFGWVLTDLPISIDVLKSLETRLGGSTLEPRPTKWDISQLVPDQFGPKPVSHPRSFFGAVFLIDCPDENEILYPAKHSTDHSASNESHDEEERQHPVITVKGKHGSSPQGQLVLVPEDSETPEIFNHQQVKRNLTKVLNLLDLPEDVIWSRVEGFYGNLSLPVLKRIDNWTNPEESYGIIAKAIEEVMKENRKTGCFGITPEMQKEVDKTLYDVCKYIWDYRSAIRHQIARRMLGSQMTSAVVHYLFKQDIVLIRDVYVKCQARLYEIVKESPDDYPKNAGKIGPILIQHVMIFSKVQFRFFVKSPYGETKNKKARKTNVSATSKVIEIKYVRGL